MKWTIILTAALVSLFACGAVMADAPTCDAQTYTPFSGQEDAESRCGGTCAGSEYGDWNGQWTNTPDHGDYAVCGCAAPSKDTPTRAIGNQQDAEALCPEACAGANGQWNGQWTNASESTGGPACGCYVMKSEDVTTRPINGQADAEQLCPQTCSDQGGSWNGGWTNDPPSGLGPVCGCTVPNCD